MDEKRQNISFVIPALNEEKHIGGVIDSIKSNMIGDSKYEIIVVDNGSVDGTIDIAKSKGARVFNKPGLTVSALRNFGVSRMVYENIVFLDTDVYLGDGWGERIETVIEELERDGMIITGSICGIRYNASWIEKCWWGPVLSREKVNYINSGHLIVTREIFEEIGGFNEELESGEDYEFCKRARQNGIKIFNNPELEVIHQGYPKTVREFFRRERWHGRGDFRSFKNILNSKAATLSMFQFGILFGSVAGALWTLNLWFLLVYFLIMILLCGSAAFYRSGKINSCLAICTFLYGVYFIARTLSFLDIMSQTVTKKE